MGIKNGICLSVVVCLSETHASVLSNWGDMECIPVILHSKEITRTLVWMGVNRSTSRANSGWVSARARLTGETRGLFRATAELLSIIPELCPLTHLTCMRIRFLVIMQVYPDDYHHWICTIISVYIIIIFCTSTLIKNDHTLVYWMCALILSLPFFLCSRPAPVPHTPVLCSYANLALSLSLGQLFTLGHHYNSEFGEKQPSIPRQRQSLALQLYSYVTFIHFTTITMISRVSICPLLGCSGVTHDHIHAHYGDQSHPFCRQSCLATGWLHYRGLGLVAVYC